MKYYVISTGHNAFDIVKVLPPDEANFLQDYGQQVHTEGTDLATVLHSFASRKAAEWHNSLPLQPKLSGLKKYHPGHSIIRLQAYYREGAGWITCTPLQPGPFTWIDQFKVALMAGATKCRLALSSNKTGKIKYAELSPNDLLT